MLDAPAPGFHGGHKPPPWPLAIAAVLLAAAWVVEPAAPPDAPDERAAERADALDVRFGLPSFEAELPFDPRLVPRLRMPFAAGSVVMCAQGNASGDNRTHSLPQNLHALDFASRSAPELVVVAAAPGVVEYVVNDAGEDPDAGGGYGNQVRLVHWDRLYTLYAHLDRVDVRVGEVVPAGQRLGTAGRSGLAGDRHLHFSLHYGVVTAEGVPATLAIPELVTRDFGAMTGFEVVAGGELRCSPTGRPWVGHLYASENGGQAVTLGPAPAELEARVQEAALALERSANRRERLWEFSMKVPRTTALAARGFLAPVLAEDPDDPVSQYAWAVEVEMPIGDWQSAERHLRLAEALSARPNLFEPWLVPWIENQRGLIALRRHRNGAAEEHFRRALSLHPMREAAVFARRGLEQTRRPRP